MRKIKICSLLSCIVLTYSAFANSLPSEPESFYQSISGSSVRMDSLFTVLDDKFDVPTPPPVWSTIDTIYSVKDYVNFELNNDLHWKSSASFTCYVDLEITRWDANGDSV